MLYFHDNKTYEKIFFTQKLLTTLVLSKMPVYPEVLYSPMFFYLSYKFSVLG